MLLHVAYVVIMLARSSIRDSVSCLYLILKMIDILFSLSIMLAYRKCPPPYLSSSLISSTLLFFLLSLLSSSILFSLFSYLSSLSLSLLVSASQYHFSNFSLSLTISLSSFFPALSLFSLPFPLSFLFPNPHFAIFPFSSPVFSIPFSLY